MEQYYWFVLGTVFGLAIAVYFFLSKEERIEKTIKLNKKVFSTEQLDKTMESVVNRIKYKIDEVKRELTEDEKNEIIVKCYNDNFKI